MLIVRHSENFRLSSRYSRMKSRQIQISSVISSGKTLIVFYVFSSNTTSNLSRICRHFRVCAHRFWNGTSRAMPLADLSSLFFFVEREFLFSAICFNDEFLCAFSLLVSQQCLQYSRSNLFNQCLDYSTMLVAAPWELFPVLHNKTYVICDGNVAPNGCFFCTLLFFNSF